MNKYLLVVKSDAVTGDVINRIKAQFNKTVGETYVLGIAASDEIQFNTFDREGVKKLVGQIQSTDEDEAMELTLYEFPGRTKRELAYEAIESERDYQNLLWPQCGLQGAPNPLTIGEFVLLLQEYVTRATNMWANEKKPEGQTLDFVRKIAGIAVNCMEQHGAPARDFAPVK